MDTSRLSGVLSGATITKANAANADVEAATGHTKCVTRVTGGATKRAGLFHSRVTAPHKGVGDVGFLIRGNCRYVFGGVSAREQFLESHRGGR